MIKLLRIFISSLNDVVPERLRAQIVIEKLGKKYARWVSIEPTVWETEPILGADQFQNQIIGPNDADIVVLILSSHLGMPLPHQIAGENHGIDERIPPTNAKQGFEGTVAAPRQHSVPELLAYRKQADPALSLTDMTAISSTDQQRAKLDNCWNHWVAKRGDISAVFRDFSSLDAFEVSLESNLASVIEQHIRAAQNTDRRAPPPTWLAGSPYRGLKSYRLEHAQVFFGRSEMINAAVEQLTGNAAHGRAFLLINGASGVGKSSLVHAGVLPKLMGRGIVPGVGLWRWAVMRPGSHPLGPFVALAEALLAQSALPEMISPKLDATILARHLWVSMDELAYSIEAALNRVEDEARARDDLLVTESARLIIVVDPLEELFAAGDMTAIERMALVHCLDSLARSGRVFVLAAMRSDYLDRAAETPLLIEMAASRGKLDLLQPTQDEIFEIIRGPAQAAGLEFEHDPAFNTKLDATLAAEASRDYQTLPQLAFLLNELYQIDIQDQGGSTLTYRTMKALGGLSGAITTRAEAVFDALPAEAQGSLPKVLRALVTEPREGVEPTACAAPLRLFVLGSPERAVVDVLLDPQVSLLVVDSNNMDVNVRLVNETVITHWQRAKNIVVQYREDLRTYAAIEKAKSEWLKAEQHSKPNYLLSHPQLANAIDLAKRWGDKLDETTRDFIKMSRRPPRFGRRMIAAALGVCVVGAIAVSILGMPGYRAEYSAAEKTMPLIDQGNRAVKQRQQAQLIQSHRLAELANQLIRDGDTNSAMLLALEALPDAHAGIARLYAPEAEYALGAALPPPHEIWILQAHQDSIRSVAFSPDGERVVTASNDNTARLWDAANGKQLHVLIGHEQGVLSAAFSPDGKQVVTTSRDGTARLWNAVNGEELQVLRGHELPVTSAAFSPDGQKVVTTSNDNTARLWDATTGKELHVLRRHDAPITRAVFSPDGRNVVTASHDKTARVWDVRSGKALQVLRGHEAPVLSAAFSPDGRRVITSSGTVISDKDNTARLWDVASGREIRVLHGHGGVVESAAFSPDSKRILTASDDRTARLWDATDGKEILVLRRHEGYVTGAAFSADGQRVLTWSWDGTARLWDAVSGKEILSLRGHMGNVLSAAFSPNGQSVLTASSDKTARIWRVFPTTQDLVDYAKETASRCLTGEQRVQALLAPAPPSWCIEMEKSPYHAQAWKDWLRYRRANLNPPLPDSPEWQSWLVARQSGAGQTQTDVR